MGTVERPGGERYVRNQLKKHGGFDVIGKWDPDPTNKKTGKVSGSPASYVALTFKYRNKFAGVKSTAPKTVTTAPKAPAPKASEPARSAPKPAPKAKSKISQPKVGPGERLVYPRRTSTSHPTKYRGRPRVQKVPKQGKISFGEYKRPNQERDRKEYQRMLDRLPQLPTPDPIKVKPIERENLEGKTLLNIPEKGFKDPLDKLKNKYRNREGREGYNRDVLEAPKRKPSSMMASGRPKPSPVDRFTAQSSARPKTTASAGQRAMEQISSVKQQPTKRPSRFKSESFTPTRTV